MKKLNKTVLDDVKSLKTHYVDMLGIYPDSVKFKTLLAAMESVRFIDFMGVLVADCRTAKGEEFNIKDENGRSLLANERSDYVLGSGNKERFTTLVSVSGNAIDNDDKFRDALLEGLSLFKRESKKFVAAAKGMPALNGGRVVHKPVYIAVCNFGYSVHGFEKQYVID